MSKLRRDRKARAWARYTRRNEVLAGHPGDNYETAGTYKALGWLLRRKVRERETEHCTPYGVQMHIVLCMFYNW